MRDQDLSPLPDGDAAAVFAEQFAEMRRHAASLSNERVTSDTVLRWADQQNQPHFAAICRRLLLPGSGIQGLTNLRQLIQLARDGYASLLCLNHRSNLDVPTLAAILEDQNADDLFRRIIWIAGRKLEEDVGMTGILVRCFNRVIMSPPSWFAASRTEEEIHAGRAVNVAAERAIIRLRHEGWVFALFPAATRMRPGDKSTQHAIEQLDSYLRLFDFLMLAHIDGCTLPVSRDRDFTHETPRRDRMLYSFGSLQPTQHYRAEAAARFPELDQRNASAQAVEADIASLAPRR